MLWCSKREEGRTEHDGLWITAMFDAWMSLMFKEGGRENIMDFELLWCFMRECLWCSKWEEGRTSWTLKYCDETCENIFDVQNYYDVSCMNHFDVLAGREGGQNIMDFELLWCFRHELLWCSKREGGRTEHHGLRITLMFHAWITLFKKGGREDRTSWTLNYLDVLCMNYFDVQSKREGGRTEHDGLWITLMFLAWSALMFKEGGREGGQNIMDFDLLWCIMHGFIWCSKREGGRTEHHRLWITLMFHACITLMFKERGREDRLWSTLMFHAWFLFSRREEGRTEHHGLWITLMFHAWITLMFKEGGREGGQNTMDFELLRCFMHELLWCSKREGGQNIMDFEFLCRFMFHACITLMFKERGREDRTSWILNYFDVSCVNYFDVQRAREGGQNIMDFELLWCFMHVVLWCSKREDGRTEGRGLWISLMFHAWITLMFKEGGREDRTWWTLNYFDVSCMNYFVQKREGGRTEHHGLWITLMFQAWTTLMFKEGGREDRTSWTLIYLDVSCMCYFDVQRGRKGGQNIMDFEFLWCFMHGFIRCSKREGGKTQHHGLWISFKFHAWFTLFKEGGREDRTSWTCSYFDVSCFDVQRRREGGQNMMDFELLRCLMRECPWCSKREGGRTSLTLNCCDVSCVNVFDVQRGRKGEHHGLWSSVMKHVRISLMFKITMMFHAWMTLVFLQGGREDRTSWTLNYFDVSGMNYFDVQRGREGGQNIMDLLLHVQRGREGGQNTMDFELLRCFMHELLWCSKREGGRTEHHGHWITLMFQAWTTLMFKVRGREGGRTEHHRLWITLTFLAWSTLMFKEGRREDRTSLTLNYFDVSCVSCFDVQRGRKGGQNIMDFVNYFDVSCM